MHFLVRQSLPYKFGFDILDFPENKSENHSKYCTDLLTFLIMKNAIKTEKGFAIPITFNQNDLIN